jgi:hypothetical protein
MLSPFRQSRRVIANTFTSVRNFIDDESGSYLVFGTILMPLLIGVAALGTEGAQVLTLHRQAQAAADSAAVSVASHYVAQYNPLLTAPTSANLQTQAQAVVVAYPGMSGAAVTMNNPPASGNFQSSNCPPNGGASEYCAFEVIVSQSHSPLLSSYWLPNAMTVKARAVALIGASGIGGGSSASCVLALGKSSVGGPADLAEAITAKGNAQVNLQGCSIGTNSNASSATANQNAIYFGSNGSAATNLIETNSILGGRVSAVGGASIVANCSTPGGGSCVRRCTSLSACGGSTAVAVTPVTGAAATPNPYAGVTVPTASTCTAIPSAYQCTPGSNTAGWCFNKVSSPNPITLNPGTYCGGISFTKGNDTYNLNPGVYILASTNSSQGLTDNNGSITLNGTGVTLVFTSADGTYPPASSPIMNVPNDLTLNLTAPTTGTTAGLVIMGDSSMPLGTAGQVNSSPSTGTGSQFVIANGATMNLTGAIYVPNGALSLIGNGAVNMTCGQIIANVIDFTNSGSLNENCTTNSSGGIGAGSLPPTFAGTPPLLVE